MTSSGKLISLRVFQTGSGAGHDGCGRGSHLQHKAQKQGAADLPASRCVSGMPAANGAAETGLAGWWAACWRRRPHYSTHALQGRATGCRIKGPGSAARCCPLKQTRRSPVLLVTHMHVQAVLSPAPSPPILLRLSRPLSSPTAVTFVAATGNGPPRQQAKHSAWRGAGSAGSPRRHAICHGFGLRTHRAATCCGSNL